MVIASLAARGRRHPDDHRPFAYAAQLLTEGAGVSLRRRQLAQQSPQCPWTQLGRKSQERKRVSGPDPLWSLLDLRATLWVRGVVSEEILLIRPTLSLAADFQRLAQEHLIQGDTRYQDAARNIPAFIKLCADYEVGRCLPEGWVPQSTFWLMQNRERILGCSRLRHELTPFLSREGGHIGYDIRSSERGKGYGTLLLRLTLDKARELGIGEVLITADEANIASWKVIERNGGKREDGCFSGTGGPFRRYWVPI
jgi:predicted acetyltransferase